MTALISSGTVQWQEIYQYGDYEAGSRIWDWLDSSNRRGLIVYSGKDTATSATSFSWIPQGSYFFTENANTSIDYGKTSARLGLVTSGVLTDIALGGSSVTKLTDDQDAITDEDGDLIIGDLRTTDVSDGTASDIVHLTEIDIANKQLAALTIDDDDESATGVFNQLMASAGAPKATLNSITVTDGGAYAATPSVSVSGGNPDTEASGLTLTVNEVYANIRREAPDGYYYYETYTYYTVETVSFTNAGEGYSSPPTVSFDGVEASYGLGKPAVATATLNAANFTNETSGSDANIQRVVGNQINLRFNGPYQMDSSQSGFGQVPSGTFTDNDLVYDYAIGGDGSVSIGPVRSIQTIDSTTYGVIMAGGSTSGKLFAWPGQTGSSDTAPADNPYAVNNYNAHISTIIDVGADFLADGADRPTPLTPDTVNYGCYENLVYGHTFNFQRGINIDLGQNDGNDINLATGWSYTDTFWPDTTEKRPASLTPADGTYGWKVASYFDLDDLPDITAPGGVEEVIASLNLLKTMFSGVLPDMSGTSLINLLGMTGSLGMIATYPIAFPFTFILDVTLQCTDDNYPFGVENLWGYSSELAVDSWDSIENLYNFGVPKDAAGVPLITAADFTDCLNPQDDYSEYLDGARLNVERRAGAAADFISGTTVEVWEDTSGLQWEWAKIADGEVNGEEQCVSVENYLQVGIQWEVNVNGCGVSQSIVNGTFETSSDKQVDIGVDVMGVGASFDSDGLVVTLGRAAGSKMNTSLGTLDFNFGVTGLELKTSVAGLKTEHTAKPNEDHFEFGAGTVEFHAAAIGSFLETVPIKTWVDVSPATSAGTTGAKTQVFGVQTKTNEVANSGAETEIVPAEMLAGGSEAGAAGFDNGTGSTGSSTATNEEAHTDVAEGQGDSSEVGDHVDDQNNDTRQAPAHSGQNNDVRDSVSGSTGRGD